MALAAKARVAMTSSVYGSCVDRVEDMLDDTARLLEPPLAWLRSSIIFGIESAYKQVHAIDRALTTDESIGKSKLQGRVSLLF